MCNREQRNAIGQNMEVKRGGYPAVPVTSEQAWFRTTGLALFAAVVLSACGGGGSGGGDAVPPRPLTTISITPTDVTLEALGATAQLEATARDQNGNILSAQFGWSSSDTAVVTVDAEGLVTAASNGMATVTVRSGSVSAPVTVTVRQTPASITLSSEEVVLTALGEVHLLEASVIDANDHAFSGQLTWVSSDAAVATVDADGRITAQGNGTTAVTATVGSVSGSVDVTVRQAVSTIDLVPATVTLSAIDQRAQFAATALDANGHPVDADIGFTSSEPMVAEIGDEGLAIARRNGVSTITARAGSVSDTATVMVMQVLASIILVPDNVTLTAIGHSAQLQVMALDANGYPMNVDVSLSSSDPAVASVNAAGSVTAQANGTVTVTASAGRLSDSTAVTVDQQVASVSLLPVDTSALDTIGATVQLQAVARDANGHTVPVEFDWASSDPSIATVDGSGLVMARGDGMTEIRASSGGFSDALTLNLSLRRAAQIIVTPASSLLEAFGATEQLEVNVLDADGQAITASVDWASSDSAIAAVSASGLIEARGNGTVTITARRGEAAGTVSVKVLQKIGRIRITPERRIPHPFVFTSLGQTVQFTFDALDPNGHVVSGAVLTVRSRDSAVVSIDDRFLATAVANGRTVFVVRVDWVGHPPEAPALSGSAYTVQVRQVAATLEIEPTARMLRSAGETHRFTGAARDANGHALPAEVLIWDTADRRVADIDMTGLVSVTGVGVTTVRVSTAEGLSASATVTSDLQATCASGDRIPSIESVAPATLVEGTTFEISGQGFCGDSAGNLVTVDRMLAAVEASSETRLSVTVPQYHCLPSRRVELKVAVGQNRATRAVDLEPDEPAVSVPVGRQAIWGAGQDKCLQFPAEAGEETYLIGVQSTSLEPSYDLTPVRLIASTSEADASTPAVTPPRTLFQNAQPLGVPATPTAAGGAIIAPLPEEPAFGLPALSSETQPPPVETLDANPISTGTIAFPDQGDIEFLPEEGDLVRIPNKAATWLVYKVGAHALWLVDTNFVERMKAHYPGRLEALARAFDNAIYPVISDYFGAPDLGKFDRVVMIIDTPRRIAGPFGKDGRQWYGIAIGVQGTVDVLAHEFVHVVQIAGAGGGPYPRSPAPGWFEEGQAQLGVEQYTLVQTNRTTGQNYGRSVAFDTGGAHGIGWDANFLNLPLFFGGDHSQRPQECSWLANDSAPCLGQVLFYVVGWSLNRWLTDQYGRLYPGGEANLHRELIHGPDDFIDTIEQQLGEPMETLLARWAAALYVDDRIPNLDPDLQFTSWNFYDIYREHPNRLMPLEISFSHEEHRARIRGRLVLVRERIRFPATLHRHPCAGPGRQGTARRHAGLDRSASVTIRPVKARWTSFFVLPVPKGVGYLRGRNRWTRRQSKYRGGRATQHSCLNIALAETLQPSACTKQISLLKSFQMFASHLCDAANSR